MSLKLISKEHISLKSYFDKDSVGVDLDEYLRNNEKNNFNSFNFFYCNWYHF